MVKELHQLKGAGDPLPGDPVGRASLDLLAAKNDAARLGGEKARHQVEQGGLAGAVGADDRLDRALRHPKAHLLHGLEAAEGQADFVQCQQYMVWFQAHKIEVNSYFQKIDLSFVGADLCVHPGLRAHTQVRPYS